MEESVPENNTNDKTDGEIDEKREEPPLLDSYDMSDFDRAKEYHE